ncbi:MAG: class I SAM-dependent methyltransferase [Planctomycetes bacterium]|nr:class I SAM-dependent methyltransferase [Planctomycetota bacterium]
MGQVDSKYPARTNYQDPNVAEVYDAQRLKNVRDRVFHNMEIKSIARAARSMPAEWRVIELPSGTGRTLVPLAERFAFVQGVDISEQMLSVARRRFANAKNVQLNQANGEALPFKDNEFNAAFSCRLFGHTPPEVRMSILKELARVSSDRLAIMLYVNDPLIKMRKAVQYKLRPPRGPWYPIDSMREVEEIMSKLGFKIVSVDSLLPGFMQSRMVVAKKL